jgi:hypothetical protein
MTPKEDQQPMTKREELDFTTMSGVDLLDYCRDDASKWAEAFCQIKQRQGWSADDIDEGLMACWFANAIEHSSDVRRLASRQEVSVSAPRVTDNDRDEITITLDGKELRGWSYSSDQERRTKMLCAREFVEGFCTGRQS